MNFDDPRAKHRTESSMISTPENSDTHSCCSTESTECLKINCSIHAKPNVKQIRITRDVYSLHQFEQRHRVANDANANTNGDGNGDGSGKPNLIVEDGDANPSKYHAPRGLAQRFMPNNLNFRSIVFGFFPILTWLPRYSLRVDLLPDILCGFTVLAINVPQGLAYTEIADVKPEYGLYVGLFAVLVYSIFGTSRHLSVGTYAVVTLMCKDVADRFGKAHPGMDVGRIDVLATLCFLTGIVQFIVGFLRLGMWTTLLSDNFLSAFLVGCAILIFNSQIPGFLGIKVSSEYENGPIPFINDWRGIVAALPEARVPTIIIGSVALAFLVFSKYYFDPYIFRGKWKMSIPFPIDLLSVIVTTLLSVIFSFHEKYKVAVVGHIPKGIDPPIFPRMDYASELILDAVIMMIVSSVCSWSLAKMVAKRQNYPVSVNQEFIAYGACNFVGSFFDCFPMSGSLSRTTIQDRSGGRTQMASLVNSLALIIFIFFLTEYLEALPKVTLCAIILASLIPSFEQLRDVKKIWKVSRFECLLWVITFLAVSLFGVSVGIIAGLLTSILILLVRAAVPTSTVKYPVHNSEIYVSPTDYDDLNKKEMFKHKTVVFAFQGPLTFLSAATFRTDLENKVLLHLENFHTSELQVHVNEAFSADSCEHTPTIQTDLENGARLEEDGSKFTIILDMSQMLYIDLTGLETLQKTHDELKQQNIDLVLASCSISVLSTLERANFFATHMHKSRCFVSVHDAVIAHRNICVFNCDAGNGLDL